MTRPNEQAARAPWQYNYTPTARQQRMHSQQPDELLYGGAAGGGKTDGLLAAAITSCLLIPNFKALLLRRTYPDLEQEIVTRLRARIPPHIATYHTREHTFIFRHNRAELRLGYVYRPADAYRYQGAEYQLILWDELTQFGKWEYDYLNSRLRAAGQVATDLRANGLKPRTIATANPGGRGHQWVKSHFVDPSPPDTEFPGTDTEDQPTGLTRMYVPATMRDNPHIDAEQYAKSLSRLDPVLRRALRDGDWDILEGTRFSQWRRSIHVISPDQLPDNLYSYPRAIGVDWGSAAPFAALWGALLPDNLIIIYREIYKTGLTPSEQAEQIAAAEAPGERTRNRSVPIALDPACWTRPATNPLGTPLDKDAPPPGSIAHFYRQKLGTAVRKARNERIPGWALLDDHLRTRPDGLPRLLVLDTCPNLIRTLPALPRSPQNPEDVDTNTEDHAPDALRYLLQLLAGGGTRHTDHHPAKHRTAPITAGLGQQAL